MRVVVPEYEAQPIEVAVGERIQDGDEREIVKKVASIKVASLDVVERELFQNFQCSRRDPSDPSGP